MAVRGGVILASVVLAVLLAGLLSFLLPERSYACSCLPLGSPTEELEESAAVFMGKVTSITILEGTGPYDRAMNEFAVTTVWKGRLAETRFIRTEPRGMCGRTFGEGEEYVVYAATSDHKCSRTRMLSAASSDLVELGKGHAPIPGTSYPVIEAGGETGENQESTPTPTTPTPTPTTPTPTPTTPNPTPTTPNPTPTTPNPEPAPDSGGGCGLSSHKADLAILGLIVGIVGIGIGRRRFNTQ